MVNAIGAIKVNSGLCPHGMPFGACPICSGKSSGASSATNSTSTTKAKANEMTWEECYAIGQMLKAEKQRAADAVQFQHLQNELKTQNKLLEAMNNQLATFINSIKANITNPISQNVHIAMDIVKSTFSQIQQNLLQSPITQKMQVLAEKLKQTLINISDKLAAIFGEPIAAAEKFIAENWKKLKKFFSVFKVDTEMEQGDDEENANEFKKWLKINPSKLFKKNLDDTLSIWKKGQLIAKLIFNSAKY